MCTILFLALQVTEDSIVFNQPLHNTELKKLSNSS
ncbi:hypothetical protein pb186bvf_019672, partial [Paramecium bursaria]